MSTNDLNQVAAVAQDLHAQAVTNWPAICAFAALAGRELRNLNLWCQNVAEWVIRHGGIAYLICKLIWNRPAKP